MENMFPSSAQKQRRTVARMGVLLSKLSIIGTLLAFATALSVLGIVAYYFILVVIVLVSFFTLLANPGFMALFSGAEHVDTYVMLASQMAPYVLWSTLGCSVVSLILLAFDKQWPQVRTSKAASIITLVLSILLLVLYTFLLSKITA